MNLLATSSRTQLPLIVGICSAAATLPLGADTAPADAERGLGNFLSAYCYDCHGNETTKAGINLEEAMITGQPQIEDVELWEDILDMVETREMPPERKPQPEEDERQAALAFIGASIEQFQCSGPNNPGRVTVRRLNREEYRNAVRDLLHVDFDPSSRFPQDEVGYGYDNIGDVLSLSPVLMEKYLDAAESVAGEAILAEIPAWPPVVQVEGESMDRKGGDHIRVERDRYLGLFREGSGSTTLPIEENGRYRLVIHAYEDEAGDEHARMGVKIDDQEIGEIEVSDKDDYELTITLERGDRRFEFAFLNNYNQRGDRNLYIDHVRLVGPLDRERPPLPASHLAVIDEAPKPGRELALARRQLTAFASRAYRRPVESEDMERLLPLLERVMDDGGSYGEAMRYAIQAILVSPRFLFRWELDDRATLSERLADDTASADEVPAVDSGSSDGGGDPGAPPRPLDAWEVASRLSFFLWSSIPDAALTERAADGSLLEPEILRAEVRRMLADPRAEALVRNFAGQWLQTRNLATHAPDPELFPDFDEALREAMRAETEAVAREIILGGGSILDFLAADYTYVNERLARHYGWEGVRGEALQRVSLGPETRRRGVLTHAGILALTSNPTRTSPVVRGKWILEQILGTPPPPPPPDVEELDESPQASKAASLRERLEQHRSKPDCISCHEKMDPLGFALENFDAIGRWRDRDGEFAIDASGTLADGRSFSGAAELAELLAANPDFVRNFCRQLMTYAIGRGLEYYDRCVIDEIAAGLTAREYSVSYVIEEIVVSDPFLKRNLPPTP